MVNANKYYMEARDIGIKNMDELESRAFDTLHPSKFKKQD